MVLLVLLLLGVIAASSSFYVYADRSATQSSGFRLQAREAAIAGLEKVMLRLRTDQGEVSAWYHNPEEYHRVIVWGSKIEQEQLGTTEEFDEVTPIYRFSIVADDPLDDEVKIRFGITDESAKLNINTATRAQLSALIGRFIDEEEDNLDELVDALIDWRDKDTTPGQFGAETEYYARLEPPYAVKNGPFDTIEELLLVRGFDAEILYGEDYDRNGLLSPNERDTDLTFPPDNGDDVLDRGLYPFITVYSRSMNRASDNRPRVLIPGNAEAVTAQLSEFTDDPQKLQFIASAGNGNDKLQSPADLLKSRQVQGEGEGETVEEPSPLTVEDMIWVMDRCTTSKAGEFTGLININTAPREVLASLGAFTEEEITAIIDTRAELFPEDKVSTGWIAPILGADRFADVAPLLTARGARFHVESMGYGDHIGTVVRLETIIEMRGPIGQIVYNRDITMIGTAFPIQYAEGDPELEGFKQ